MPSPTSFYRYMMLMTSGFIATAGYTRSTVLLESSRGCDKDDGDNSDDASTEDTLRVLRQWFQWSKVAHTTDAEVLIKEQNSNNGPLINELRLKEKYAAPKYPVVLCHGLSGFDKLMVIPSPAYLIGLSKHNPSARRDFIVADRDGVALEYWYGIKEALESKGTTVMVAKVPGFGSIEERASILNDFITKEVERLRHRPKDDIYNAQNQSEQTFKQKGEKMKINLVAHSMGGLDARYLISELENANYEVVSLTTVTTPHRGSEMADYVLDLSEKLPNRVQIPLPPSFKQLTTEHMKRFNQQVKDDPKVHYFSYGAEFNPAWYNIFYASWSIINSRAGPNDGMVSVESSKWGSYLGTLMNVDHLDLINWTNGFKQIMSSLTPGTRGPQIDSVALYLEIADNLAKRGL
ncbi:triglyceride lipase [Cyberlindnera jadinii NRRL Y-1542]|uniref:Alpha/beta-hydrolase n=1 Tax=Cyberlindnera jadinii (strain ATCC 18201 / CBS 1600 / BCRC 20928 / JCM 3617 / NBRC 0987 / NRRL Y-1542) TaxID=983966 RepID=A0A1E4S425_CYBJN|nr:alpha/beta-hydrolase [Cyberlindnera jadinii NRRL Y-1542]ODV74278.1 alpha/beta-hydrolase [Cyberlindnera jadinii NRRL Y-1542]